MAMKRIQDLAAAAALDGTELVELEQAGGSVQCTTQDIADLASGSGMTNPMTTAEDIIVGGVAGAPARLPIGADGDVLTVVAGALAYAAPGAGSGTVTSVGSGTGLTGGPITGSGSLALSAGSIASLALADTAMQPGDGVSIITEASTSTMDPATHAGLNRYIRAADDVTFNTSESYTAGEVYNIRATAALTLVGTGVTLTPPAGGTLDLDSAMSVMVVMTSSSAGDVIGQTVAA